MYIALLFSTVVTFRQCELSSYWLKCINAYIIQNILASLEETSATPVISIPPPPPLSASNTAMTPTLSRAEQECLNGILY